MKLQFIMTASLALALTACGGKNGATGENTSVKKDELSSELINKDFCQVAEKSDSSTFNETNCFSLMADGDYAGYVLERRPETNLARVKANHYLLSTWTYSKGVVSVEYGISDDGPMVMSRTISTLSNDVTVAADSVIAAGLTYDRRLCVEVTFVGATGNSKNTYCAIDFLETVTGVKAAQRVATLTQEQQKAMQDLDKAAAAAHEEGARRFFEQHRQDELSEVKPGETIGMPTDR